MLNHDHIRWCAAEIGSSLEASLPASSPKGVPCIPSIHVEDITDAIAIVVAEILQSWLNAGSERDNTIEELTPAIRDHVASWSCDIV